MGVHWPWRAESRHNVKYNTSFDEPPIAVTTFFHLALYWPSKVSLVGVIAPRKNCSTTERSPKNSLPTGRFIPKKYQSLFFYDNRDLKISRSKKSGQYFRDKFHGHFARHFESHRRETWRHTGRRTEPPTKTLYQNNLTNIAFFSTFTFFQGLKM